MNIVETMKKIEQAFNENPAPFTGVNTVYQFELSGEAEGSYQLQLKEGEAKVVEGNAEPADCTLIMSTESFLNFLKGSLKGTVAFMTGKLKIKGDMGKALKLESILKQYNLSELL